MRVLTGLHPDRIPNVEFGYWEETITRWHNEGLPSHCTSDSAIERHLGLEGVTIFVELPIRNGLFPPFERKVIHQDGDRRTILDEEGNLCEVIAGHSSIPRYIQYGLRTRDDWERLKRERLDPDTEGRFSNPSLVVKEARETGKPVFFNAGSLYGWLRNWMGLEGLSIALMTEKAWVEEMMDHLTELTLTLIERASVQLSGDLAWWWEDMCYNRGPLISPRLFREMMVPRYRLITGALRKYGIDINVVDCDGRIHELVPGWLDAGINCMFPLEAAHTDVFRLREDFGNRVLLMGGVDKLALIAGRESIDREIERLIPLAQQGRYIPCLDHRVPPDVSFENYLYYLQKKEDLLTV
ncbi:MAG: uroporphyrinogen decarboxylase family protein [Ignavibacteria bacterium]|nr:uroporphyrinogen decarboxylase family protein [Ignavibacteria bacterium]